MPPEQLMPNTPNLNRFEPNVSAMPITERDLEVALRR
jgi:hypothetical protein